MYYQTVSVSYVQIYVVVFGETSFIRSAVGITQRLRKYIRKFMFIIVYITCYLSLDYNLDAVYKLIVIDHMDTPRVMLLA